ncbi:hypothetical protein F2Q69_00045118 [Brassica cretica]|uniref:Uncharacterized protein n=1 Tax=Brassica cretica TaxID=69181 RepID=A0A8S9NDH5_BRACR|nr:hypothetical protein F2Q69_00045118 [Brassica cretica]
MSVSLVSDEKSVSSVSDEMSGSLVLRWASLVLTSEERRPLVQECRDVFDLVI